MRTEYASFWRRLGAASMDSLVWFLGFSFFVPASLVEDNELAAGIIGLVFISAWFNYFAICEWRWGQTIGKNAFGIRVVPVLTGEKLSYNAAALRNLLRIVDFPLWITGIGYATLRNSPRSQRLGDRAAGTVVVRDEAPQVVAVTPASGSYEGDSGSGTSAAAPTSADLFSDATEALKGSAPAASAAPTEAPNAPTDPPPDRGPKNATSFSGIRPTGVGEGVVWGPGAAIGGTLLAILAGIVLGIPFGIADPDVGTEDGGVIANIGIQLASVAGFIFVPLVLAAGGERGVGLRRVLGRLGLRRFGWKALGWTLVAYLAYIAIAALYAGLVTVPEQEDIAPLFGPLATQIFLIVICAAVAEEICFRGFLFGGLRRGMGPVPAALISAAIFGGLHALTGVSAVPPLIAFGFVLALLYERTGSIGPPIILHAINNSLALAIAS